MGRARLLCGALGMFAAGPEFEQSSFGGSATGAWSCGPAARMNYGGAGGNVTWHEDDRGPSPGDKRGFAIVGGASAEGHTYHRIDDTPHNIPSPSVQFGTHAQLGWDWRYFGFGAGALAWDGYKNAGDSHPIWRVIPEAHVRFGPRDSIWGGLGVGSYNVPTIQRPGGYLTIGARGWKTVEAEARFGAHAAFFGSDDAAARFDFALSDAVTPVVRMGAGVAISQGRDGDADPEGQLFMRFTP